MALISDRVTRVVNMLGNRSDLTTRAYAWIWDAYLELGMSYDFEELEDTWPDGLVANVDIYDYPPNARAVKALTRVEVSTGESVPLKKKSIKNIRRYNKTQKGPPAIWAPYKNQIYIRPVPDKSYDLMWDIWVKPVQDSTIQNTEILLPWDWLEIVDIAAVARGFSELLEDDKAMAKLQLLHGAEDPRTGRRFPGLIAQRLQRKHAEAATDEFGMTPMVRKYCS